jgi:guanosine-3',5'-bis(diphosphate) 3'-pyrophosphohydrolase
MVDGSSAGTLQLEKLIAAIVSYHPTPNLDLVRSAYRFAEEQHRGQVRASGEPYINHLFETAILACQLKLDIASVVAALLHDTIEDSLVTRDELAKKFSLEIAEIVEGVTKLTRIEFESREEKQAESFRKLLIAMARDIRVVLVKLCDRLHNMRTLAPLPEEKRRRIAQETKEIYAPLANRLGIHWMKSELEDLCLYTLRPEVYKMLEEQFGKGKEERVRFIEEVTEQIHEKLSESGVSGSITGRAKHLSSIWTKMERDNLAYDEVYDVLGFRIIVPTVRACYETLGIIHAAWKPVPNRFKDYIAMPKANMYQSLHTTVIGPSGNRIEVQIRTPEMSKIADEGIAAHWRYKEGSHSIPGFDLNWVKQLVETQAYLKSPDEFIQSVKGELFPEEVFVFTPKGDLIRLQYGSTPVDFAYAVHTDVGHRTTGARVNGQMVTLDHRLSNGDTIEVITAKNHSPSKDWLRFVKSSKAKQRVRAFLKSEGRFRSLALGIEVLTKDLKKAKLNLKKLEKEGKIKEVAESFGLKEENELYADIGYGKLHVSKVLAKILPTEVHVGGKKAEADEPTPLERLFQRAARASRQRVGVKVSGLGDVLVRFAKCCEPLPGDRIVGFVTRGRGVTVHYADCPVVHQSDVQRQVEVAWEGEPEEHRKVRIIVHSQDQLGLLALMSQAITNHGANIISAQCKTSTSGKAVNTFELGVKDAKQLDKVKRAIELVPGVTKVERVNAGE